jgi:hypothetical protein
MVPAKAKNCIFLMMEGGPSHIDCFDPKPMLEKFHLKEFTREGKDEVGDGERKALLCEVAVQVCAAWPERRVDERAVAASWRKWRTSSAFIAAARSIR